MTTLSTRNSNEITGLSQINEEYEEDSTDILMKKYENMSFEEMSKQMAESNKLMSEMLSTSTSMTSSHSTSDKEEEEEEVDEGDEPSKKWTMLFAKTASNGDLTKLKEMLADDSIRPFIDLNAKDSDGTPPLIYAACFGKIDIAKLLIEAGANVDAQDNFGWSALMWATNNSHEALVKVLLDNGASSQTKSAKGRTVYDFVNTENQKIVDILATNPRDSISSTSSLFFRTSSSISSSTSSAGDNDFYYQSTVEGYQQFVAEEAELRQKLFEQTMAAFEDMENTATDDEQDSDEDNEQDDSFDENEFHWDKCSPDQMFVFNSDDLDYILDTIITNIQLPLSNQHDIYVPANVIFLSARFAHYFSTPELLEQVLDGALKKIRKTIKANACNIHILAFWTTNLTQLLFYLKKDTGLVIVTAEQQLHISELVSETYNMIIQDTEKRLIKVLGSAMLDHEEIPDMDQVDFTDDWHRFFRKSAKRSVTVAPDGGMHSAVSPQSVTSLLSSTLFVLQSYDVHPIIVIQAMAQFFHFISCELFNRILTNKKLLCRSKAMQVRMNFSHLEDWIAVNRLPNHLLSYLNPTIQLLQLLQCLTQLRDLVDFINTTKEFDALNTPQVKRCVISYRYEVNEPKLPEEIEKYAIQCAEDTVRYKQRKQSMDKARPPVSRNTKLARRQSMSQYLGLTSRTPIVEPSTSSPIKKNIVEEDLHQQDDDDDKDIKEIKDSKFMLPFSVPTTAHMMDKHQDNQPRQMIPIIPEEWMDKLDEQKPSVP